MIKVIILAAGYATRLYPHTLTRAKPLLPVAGKPIIEYVLDNLAPIAGIERIYVVANSKFVYQFRAWAAEYRTQNPQIDLTIIDDGSTDENNRLGAIGDLHLVMTQEAIQDDMIVVGGDNLFSQSLEDFARFFRKREAPVLGVYDIGNLEDMKRYGGIRKDRDDRIISFEEKSEHPSTTLASAALYFYPKGTLHWIRQYVAAGNNMDQPGRLVQWLFPRIPFYAWQVPGRWFDIGSKDMLDEAERIFAMR